MSKTQKKWSAEFKLKLVFESLRGEKTLIQLASEHALHPRQILRWREMLVNEAENIFADHRIRSPDSDKEKLLTIIEQLTLELEFVKKKLKRNV